MGKIIEYGEGGHDPSKPNNNIVNEYETDDIVSDEIISETVAVPISALEQLADNMADPSINSIAEIKSSFLAFIEATQNG